MSEHVGDKPDDGRGTAESEDEEVIFPEEASSEDSTEEDANEASAAEAAIAEKERMREQLLRIAADFDNFRKRSRKEIEEVRRRAIEDTVREVLPIIDNLERAAEATSGAKDVDAVAEGVHMVLRGFEEVANRLGLERVPSVGETFDPNLHDAMQQEETDKHPPGTIVSEVVPGYKLGERLLRPAVVVVARPPSAADAGAEGDAGTEGSSDA